MNKKIALQGAKGQVNGYCLMSEVGEITFYLTDHQPVISVKKSPSGWFIVRLYESRIKYEEVSRQLVLHLEDHLYN